MSCREGGVIQRDREGGVIERDREGGMLAQLPWCWSVGCYQGRCWRVAPETQRGGDTAPGNEWGAGIC